MNLENKEGHGAVEAFIACQSVACEMFEHGKDYLRQVFLSQYNTTSFKNRKEKRDYESILKKTDSNFKKRSDNYKKVNDKVLSEFDVFDEDSTTILVDKIYSCLEKDTVYVNKKKLEELFDNCIDGIYSSNDKGTKVGLYIDKFKKELFK